MKLIFFVTSFFYFFPINAHAAWVFIPDTLTINPISNISFFDAAGVRTEIFFATQPAINGGFIIDPLLPLTPTPLNAVGAVIPPLPQALLTAASIQTGAALQPVITPALAGLPNPLDPFPAIDWLQSSIVTAFFLFLWSLAYSGGLVTATIRKGA